MLHHKRLESYSGAYLRAMLHVGMPGPMSEFTRILSAIDEGDPHASDKLKCAAAEALPYPDQTADLVLSSLSFHHWAAQQKGLQEIARVLRPAGWFCLADHTIRLAKLFGEKPKSRKS